MLTVSGLQKTFGQVRAVDGVSFEVSDGCFFGLLGPNGAGKTTTISMIVGTLEPDAGYVEIDGERMAIRAPRAKRRIGYVPQELALYEELDARSNLRFVGAMYGIFGAEVATRMDGVLDLVGLRDRANEPVSRFSGGMKRRLNIAMALLHDPTLLVLDEPTTGVDPQSRNAIFESLKALQSQGKTLIYTTHYMEEVEKLCQRVAVMDSGKVIAEDTVAGLQQMAASKQTVTIFLLSPIESAPNGPFQVTLEGESLHVQLGDLNSELPALLNWLGSNGIGYRGIQANQASLESAFLHLTGNSLRD